MTDRTHPDSCRIITGGDVINDLHEEVHWAVSETPRAWRELPPPLPAAPGPADGESNE